MLSFIPLIVRGASTIYVVNQILAPALSPEYSTREVVCHTRAPRDPIIQGHDGLVFSRETFGELHKRLGTMAIPLSPLRLWGAWPTAQLEAESDASSGLDKATLCSFYLPPLAATPWYTPDLRLLGHISRCGQSVPRQKASLEYPGWLTDRSEPRPICRQTGLVQVRYIQTKRCSNIIQ